MSILALFVYRPGGKRVLGSKAGYGFIVPEDETVAMRRAGKQVMSAGGGARFCLPADGDHLAVIGDNGKALIFLVDELPEMPRGKGVKLQSYREGGLRDGVVFRADDGAAWIDSAGRTRAWPDWRLWLGRRAAAGRLAPRGFPASKRFRPG